MQNKSAPRTPSSGSCRSHISTDREAALSRAIQASDRSLKTVLRVLDRSFVLSLLFLPALSPLLVSMGNSSYNLHKACPELDARYKHCQALYFENSLVIPPRPDPVTGVVAPRVVYRDSIPVTDAADIALTNDALDRNSMNFACRDMWEDYKDCVIVSSTSIATIRGR